MNNHETAYWLALNRLLGSATRNFLALVEFFGSAEALWKAKRNDLSRAANSFLLKKIIEGREGIDPAGELERVERENVKVLTIKDEEYPVRLKNIFDPPILLHIRGEFIPQDELSIAVVGARRASAYGRMAAETLAGELSAAGFTVVSGMARGVDSHAHRGALQKNGRTVAVLGSGLDVIYPPENQKLAKEIEEHGAVISEYPLGSQPDPWHFPVRNRIISGMTMGTVVIEAGERSGSLITADLALQEGREVFAVPGNISSNTSKGTNKLIKEGAKLVETVEDILEEFGFKAAPPEQIQMPFLDGEEERILKVIKPEGCIIEEIIEEVKLPARIVSSKLLILETKGAVSRMPGNIYIRKG